MEVNKVNESNSEIFLLFSSEVKFKETVDQQNFMYLEKDELCHRSPAEDFSSQHS